MRITKNLKLIRNEELVNMWRRRKTEITMKEVAHIFKITTAQCYQILKEAREKELSNKFKPKI